MEHITYAESWNVQEQRPERIFAVSEARARHDAGERYSVVIGDGHRTEKVITLELATGTITARFLDRLQRVAMTRVYGQREGERMFLGWTAFYNYADDDLRGERAVHWETTSFRKDGSWNETDHYSDGTEESRGVVLDVSEQWEPIPAFGDYASISRYV